MKVSSKGLDLIRNFEGLHCKAYKDAVGVLTIGYGITNADKDVVGKTITADMTITKDTAEAWLKECIDKKYGPLVAKYDNVYHWNQNQFDALCSFCYNIGSIKQLTDDGQRDTETIARKILAYNKAGGKVLQGLVRRRKAEHDLFCEPVYVGYSGKFPELPRRGRYIVGDGYKSNLDSKSQIKRVQLVLNWVLCGNLVIDGKYGEKTAEAVRRLQKAKGLPVNGKFGNLSLKACKEHRKMVV